jgi:3-oxoadipate enol-lactonase
MWEPQLGALKGHELYAPDLYDFGSSMDAWADAVLRDLEGEFVAVGASMGGYCAGAIAEKAPARLQGIVLAGSRADADPPDRRPMRDEWIRMIRQDGAAGLWHEMGPKLFSESVDPDVVEHARQIALEQAPDGLVHAVEAIRDRRDSTSAVASGIPLLVIAGAADALIPSEVGRTLAESSPQGKVVELEGVGHLVNLQRPEEFNAALVEFLESL